MNDIGGQNVKEVLVSESSRRDARAQPNRETMRKAIDELQAERAADSERLRQVTTRLMQIRNHIRGRRLHDGDYRRLVDEQTKLVEESKAIENHQHDRKMRVKRLADDMTRIEKEFVYNHTNKLLFAILKELRILNTKLGPAQQMT
jgi:hypothetical protein